MVRLHHSPLSGNSYKVRLLLALLGIPFERVEWDALKGETRTPEFLKLNPSGKVPVLETEDGALLPESGAILCFLAEGTRYLPEERFERARVLRWMFFEQSSHEPNLATARVLVRFLGANDERRRALEQKHKAGYAALEVMEGHLDGRDFFVQDRCTIADIALYAYTHVAHEGGFDLGDFPAVRAWLDRVAAQPGYVPLTQG